MTLTSDQIIQIGGVIGPWIIDFIKSHHQQTGTWPTQEELDAQIASKADALAASIADWEAAHPR